MPGGRDERYDFFLSRRSSVAAIAREVADVLTEKGYKVLVQDYDIPFGASFIEAMHEAVKNSRDLIILFTRDYEQSPHTRKEFTSFEAERVQSTEERHIIVLRCEDVPVRGLLADNVYQDLAGITDLEERKRRIVAAAERQSQAASPPPRPFIGVPPRIASFTGRVEELDKLDAILMHDKPAAMTQAVGRAAVQGMGGVGKTSLAVEYTHRYRNLYAGVCWCPAETRTGLLSALAALAVTLGAASTDEADIEKTAKAALRRLDEQRATWLLIFDNAASPDEIGDVLPSAGARVLITSRFSDWGEMAGEVPVDVLPPPEAIALLQTRAGRSDPAGATSLAGALGYLPIALDHAAAYCKRTQMRFLDYADKATSLMATVPRGVGYPRSVAATFDLAISQAVSQCAAAEELIAFLAQCGPDRVPLLLLEGASDDDTKRLMALAVLVEMSLVKPDPFEDGTEAVTIHRLVQTVARVRSAINGSASADRVIERLDAIYPLDGEENPKSWTLCAHLMPHLLARRATGLEGASKATDLATLLTRAACYLRGRAAYSQAEAFFRDALAIREHVLGPEHPDTARSLNNLGLVLEDEGNYGDAEPLKRRALAIRENVLGPEHPDTAQSLTNVALLLKRQGNFVEARALYERALAIQEKVLGAEHPDTATSLNNLAVLLKEQGDLSGARSLLDRTLAIREKALGPEHPATTMTLNNLATVLDDQGKFAEAQPLYERALAIREQVLGPEHPETAQSLNNLAVCLEAQGDCAGSKILKERALAIREKVLGPEHPHTASSVNNLGYLLHMQGDFAGAQALYERALAIREKALGPEHPDTAASLNNLAVLLSNTDRSGDAEPLLLRAIAIGEKALGRDHPNTKRHASHYARLLLKTGRVEEALRTAQSALAKHDATCGPNHSWTKDSARVTADALDALGRHDEAKVLRERYGVGPAIGDLKAS